MSSLTVLCAIPLISALIIFFLPISSIHLKRVTIGMSMLPLLFLIFNHSAWIGESVAYSWFEPLAISFHLQVDYLSLLFLYLTAIIPPLSLCASTRESMRLPNLFYGLILLLQGFLMVFFMARDLVVFTIFWEAMLIPLYFIINLWGGKERRLASLKFLIYTIAGSALMVAAVLALYMDSAALTGTGSFNFDTLSQIAQSVPHAPWLLAIFLLAFAVKTPLFPLHAWLPDAYCQAPTTGSILLSALLSKAGIYGFLRIGVELFPDLLKQWSPGLLGLAIVGVLYGGLAAWSQTDFKRLIAYSSLAHVNFILAGLFIWGETAHTGTILQALNHSVTITALFLVAWWLEERLGSTAIGEASGLAHFLPKLCWITLFFVLASVALPGTNNFVGELLILFSLFAKHPGLTAILGLTVILSVIYMLRWMQKMYFEEPVLFKDSWIDMRKHEVAITIPLIVLIIWIGIYPKPLLQQIEPAVQNRIEGEKSA